ncbi:hypothetical protein ASE85_12050 [Sphingobium sp. Leaf26]|uniref:DUF2157 domain-containing protein n=1 Tax=Sphingobium sp. Leaf26 TaxID=1735693 RepID=UPI0006FBCB93|nr:DUF2157 domain-containing protein [Sphingobium sp. Leaf26]KQM98574.1 hypothetical protein ASE85_12050 [Sphingobium sp. Leaf26]
MSERKLRAWQAAGLIDADTASRISAWEAAHSRSIGVWAIVGLGALTIGLGLVSLIAANWEQIPGTTRLAIHMLLMIALAAWTWWSLPRGRMHDQVHDALLFVGAVLGLTFFGHLGQVYQTSSPLWQPLLAWLLLFSPFLLLFGRGWPVAGLWMAGLLGTMWTHAEDHGHIWSLFGRTEPPWLYWGLIACPPMLVAGAAALLRSRSERPAFWRLLEQMAVATIFTGLSLAILLHGWDGDGSLLPGSALIHSIALLAAAAAIAYARRTASGRATAALLLIAAALHLIQALVPYGHGAARAWISSLFFCLLWGAVAAAAIHAGWRRLFQLGVAMVALRIIILSFELNDDLLGSGVGLILSGLFAMAVAWATIRLSRRYAPARGDAA